MFKVDSYGGQGYKISIGTGQTTRARSIDEVIEALKHYFAKFHKKTICPFCKQK